MCTTMTVSLLRHNSNYGGESYTGVSSGGCRRQAVPQIYK